MVSTRATKELARLDTNGDGQITLEEFLEAGRSKDEFDRYDKDGDGTLDVEELELERLRDIGLMIENLICQAIRDRYASGNLDSKNDGSLLDGSLIISKADGCCAQEKRTTVLIAESQVLITKESENSPDSPTGTVSMALNPVDDNSNLDEADLADVEQHKDQVSVEDIFDDLTRTSVPNSVFFTPPLPGSLSEAAGEGGNLTAQV
jgi:hypothetical protein